MFLAGLLLVGAQDVRIIGGDAASQPIPYQVSLHYQPPGQNARHICGGTLISKKHVLTAAHCIKICGGQDCPADRYIVHLGFTQQTNKQGPNTHQERSVRSYVFPGKGTIGPSGSGDIAVLTLSTVVSLSDAVFPAELAAEDPKDRNGQLVTVSGWGSTQQGGNPSDTLMLAHLTLTDQCAAADCNFGTDEIFAGPNGKYRDSCQGDSGGPLVLKGTNTLVGSVSRGTGCGSGGFYTNIHMYRDKILRKIKNFLLTDAEKQGAPGSVIAGSGSSGVSGGSGSSGVSGGSGSSGTPGGSGSSEVSGGSGSSGASGGSGSSGVSGGSGSSGTPSGSGSSGVSGGSGSSGIPSGSGSSGMPGGSGSSGMPGGSGSSGMLDGIEIPGMPGSGFPGGFPSMGGSSDESTESETDESEQDESAQDDDNDKPQPQVQPQPQVHSARDILKAGIENEVVVLIMACAVLFLIVGAVALYSYGSKQGSQQQNSSYLKARANKSHGRKRRRARN